MKVSLLLFGAAVLCSSVLRAGNVCTAPDTLQLGCIYTNFGEGQTYLQDAGGLTAGYSAVGVGFTAAGSFQLQNIEVAAYRGSAEVSDTVNFSLYGTTAGFPGDLLETFTLTGLGVYQGEPGPGLLSAQSVLHPLVTGGMQYWLVMEGANAVNVTWGFNSTGVLGAATVVAPVEDVSPAHWELLPNHTQGAFALDGSPVPEPSTMALSVTCLAAAFLGRRVRR
jgi:hypothetical protein